LGGSGCKTAGTIGAFDPPPKNAVKAQEFPEKGFGNDRTKIRLPQTSTVSANLSSHQRNIFENGYKQSTGANTLSMVPVDYTGDCPDRVLRETIPS
jgi:hypothetical protein